MEKIEFGTYTINQKGIIQNKSISNIDLKISSPRIKSDLALFIYKYFKETKSLITELKLLNGILYETYLLPIQLYQFVIWILEQEKALDLDISIIGDADAFINYMSIDVYCKINFMADNKSDAVMMGLQLSQIIPLIFQNRNK